MIAKTPEAYLSNIILGYYILKLLPKGTHEYNLFFYTIQSKASLQVHFKLLKQKVWLSKIFSTHPLYLSAFFTSPYPILTMKTFVSSSTLFFFFQVAISGKFKKIYFSGTFRSRNDCKAPSAFSLCSGGSFSPPSLCLLTLFLLFYCSLKDGAFFI